MGLGDKNEMRKGEEKEEEEAVAVAADSIWDCGSPLYDSYELVSVIHLIDRHSCMNPPLKRRDQQDIVTWNIREASFSLERTATTTPRSKLSKISLIHGCCTRILKRIACTGKNFY